ncbi:proline--tRNA ligase [Paenibacillus sacheonensis]|uniref:Proline--tRNA ligase n=1 Tax=Paenibacillus sacheonensis TaxID=742054 RepID=A0A7X5BVC3_9BACL|nr:proline--tRNA ligase [Paenibacillus sacheonensis]MBM7563184.1 prolyl-tRNA synthetase [Paenibacillus sacheonensis]NBC68253.1 proline--tRNA ligase [Paenibacillus sacheonensis]
MRQQSLLAPTMRETPADAEAVSHQLLVRGGYIRQLSAGVYSFLPLGRRVLRNAERIVREEMERTGAQEVLLPALQPADLWRKSGRYEVYGPELVRLRDRGDREFVLGPTHEEVITELVGQEIATYRKLPVTLFQIQTKFRDERRPRFGLLRCREFVMKDAYSFAANWEDLDTAYRAMYDAYHRIFERSGLAFRAVEADAGAIGGEGGTHEFMAIAESGEDDVVTCSHCDYAANMEKAAGRPAVRGNNIEAAGDNAAEAEKFHTPGLRSIEDLVTALGIRGGELIKTLIYMADGKPAAVLIRGDRTLNETKVKNALDAVELELADSETVRAVTGASTGFAGPIGLQVPLLVDEEVAVMRHGVAGANETDYHVRHVVPGRDFPLETVGDFRNVAEDEACPNCEEGKLRLIRGIEIGHVFKLGTKYSEKLGAAFVDADGESRPIIMGCYGIGVTRLLSAVIEQHHDENGMIWPAELAPFKVHVIPVSHQDEAQMAAANRLYDELREAGIDTLLDDRGERLGVKLKDADLIGIPIRIVIGKGIAEGEVEWKARGSEGAAERVALDRICASVRDWLAERRRFCLTPKG